MAWQTRMRRVFAALTGSRDESAQAKPVREEVSLTQEDWYWGRNTGGTEEDFFWRRLSDDWSMKDVQPACLCGTAQRVLRGV